MEKMSAKSVLMAVVALFVLSMMGGCTTILGVEKSGPERGGDYYPVCLVQADRALDEARAAGKDKQCPDQFNAVKQLVDEAYKTHLACNTDGACKMAKEAIRRAGEISCPPPVAAPVERKTYKYCITLHTQFEICRTEIRQEYYDEMAKVGDFMKQHPETTAVIEGHTDNVPINSVTCQYKDNMALSQARAESAVNYLVDKFGIDRSRLTAKGYGDTRPVADNATDEGKFKNRRIEAIIDCVLMPQEFRPTEKLCMTLDVQFDFDKADIKPEYQDEVGKLAEFMQKFPTTTTVIAGHTDNVGNADFNMKLSQARAESVVNLLVSKYGIDRSRLTAKGYGATRPIAYNNTAEGRQKNRRVEAVVDCVPKP